MARFILHNNRDILEHTEERYIQSESQNRRTCIISLRMVREREEWRELKTQIIGIQAQRKRVSVGGTSERG